MKTPIKNAPYQPNKRTIGELLSTTNPPIVVPEWQRSYSWTTSHVEAFWNDLVAFQNRHTADSIKVAEYFIGSIVIVAASTDQHLLLDGQQRLATSAILLSIIRDFLKNYNNDASVRTQSKFLAEIDDATNKTVFKIRLNEYDKDFFQRRVLEPEAATATQPEPTHASHHLILAARSFFQGKFKEKNKELENPKTFHEWVLRIQSTLVHHVSLVAISSSDEDSAAEVFETLNDRGIGLSTPDLLRNFIMRRSVASEREEIVTLWSEVFEFESDSEIKAFLRHFWTSHYGDVKTQRLYREIRDQIEQKNLGSLQFSRDLNEASGIYKRILEASDEDDEFESLLKEIKELGATVLYPLALSSMQVNESVDRNKLLTRALNVYVRHTLVGQLEGSKIESLLFRLASNLRKESNIDPLLKELSDFSPTDDDFRKSFSKLSVSRSQSQRYLLKRIELNSRATGELVLNTNKKVHVEHIYPQKPIEGKKWPDHNNWINRLGNLTLFDGPMNSGIKNAEFEQKKPSYAKSEILITKSLNDLTTWNAEAIQARQDKMSNVCVAIWPAK